MATWDGLRSYIKSNYVVNAEEPGTLGLDFAFGKLVLWVFGG